MAVELACVERDGRLGGDPFAYLQDVLEHLSTHPADRLGELLPDAWIAAQPRARLKVAS